MLAAGSGINADQLYQLTGGNPFYVTEVLAAGLSARPGRLAAQRVRGGRGRLARLSNTGEKPRTRWRCAAHAPSRPGARDMPRRHAGLDECLGAGVMVAEGTRGVSPRVGAPGNAGAYPRPRRAALHKRALTILAEPPVDPDMLAALAFHAEQAGDTDAAVRYGIAAAERAASLGANREASARSARARARRRRCR